MMMRECVDYLSKVVYEQCMSILLAPAALPLILLLLQCDRAWCVTTVSSHYL